MNSTHDKLNFARAHGLSDEEYKRIVTFLGREPNLVEIGVLGAMWSEHCSYKSSKIHLKKLPTTGKHVLQGPGENAGIVDIGDGYCIAFKMESHNHPSFIEPFQGAATGVGGILRDIFTMGARPIAILDSLRFGSPDIERTKYIVKNVVGGISWYGNCVGVPTVGGETYFEECYNGNPLVNVFALGIVKKDKIFRGYASGIGNPVVYVGAKTGRDGIQGAIMASDIFSSESESKRPAVQVGDPFTEKLLLEACLELFETDAVVGIQDMGAAGLTSSSTEMASRAGTGITLWLDKVPRREENMTPYEVMLSESQERMLVVIKKGKESVVSDIFDKWGLDFAIIGEVTDTKRLIAFENEQKVIDIPLSLINEQAPVYERPFSPPSTPITKSISIKSPPKDLEKIFIDIMSSPNTCSKEWIWKQYDYMVRTNTLLPQSLDSSLIRIKDTEKAIAMTVNCNSRYCYANPRKGAMIAVAESARNLACTGAKPLAITDCLNFGNPENPEIMWQFKEAVEGMAEAAKTFNTPVVSGNVSLYNETEGNPIFSTPTIGMVGLLKNKRKRLTSWFKNPEDVIVLAGDTYDEIGCSEYLKHITGEIQGNPPNIDLKKELSLVEFILEANRKSLINSAHDLSEGGLVVALAECCFAPTKTIGIIVDIKAVSNELESDRILFSESQGRALFSLPKANVEKLQTLASSFSIPLRVIGKVGGERFTIGEIIDIDTSYLRNLWNTSFKDIVRNG